MAAPIQPKAPVAATAQSANAEPEGDQSLKNAASAARDRMAALNCEANDEPDPEPAPKPPGVNETYRAPQIGAPELMKGYLNGRANGRQRRLEELARKNPDVAELLKAKAVKKTT